MTEPTDAAQVPEVLTDLSGQWYGEDGLWVDAWWVSGSVSPDEREGSYPVKFGSFTLRDGKFTSRYGPPTVRAERLDGAGTVRGSTGGYAYTADNAAGIPVEFWPTVIEFPSPGCWRVTESAGDTTIRFVVEVRRGSP